MKKVRLLAELNAMLDEDLAWRKQELSSIVLNIRRNSAGHDQASMIRSLVCMMYAHWEGFTKYAAVVYLTYVRCQNITLCDLKPNFSLLNYSNDIKNGQHTRSIGKFCAIFNSAHTTHVRAIYNPQVCIETKSNLSFSTMKDIFLVLGLEVSPWWSTREKWIDVVLLGRRNEVAHGERATWILGDALEAYEKLKELLDGIRTDVENAAACRSYLRSP